MEHFTEIDLSIIMDPCFSSQIGPDSFELSLKNCIEHSIKGAYPDPETYQLFFAIHSTGEPIHLKNIQPRPIKNTRY